MFTALTWIFIVLGAVVGIVLSAGEPQAVTRFLWAVSGAAIGLLLGGVIWVASFLLILTFQVILWVILFLILTLIGYWIYRTRIAR